MAQPFLDFIPVLKNHTFRTATDIDGWRACNKSLPQQESSTEFREFGTHDGAIPFLKYIGGDLGNNFLGSHTSRKA